MQMCNLFIGETLTTRFDMASENTAAGESRQLAHVVLCRSDAHRL